MRDTHTQTHTACFLLAERLPLCAAVTDPSPAERLLRSRTPLIDLFKQTRSVSWHSVAAAVLLQGVQLVARAPPFTLCKKTWSHTHKRLQIAIAFYRKFPKSRFHCVRSGSGGRRLLSCSQSSFSEESCGVSAPVTLVPAVADCLLFLQSSAAPFVLLLVAPGLRGGCHGPGILSSQHD